MRRDSDLLFSVLGSGSGGNSVLVEGSGTAILVDAGFPAKGLRERLALIGRPDVRIAGIVITHEHSDHIQHARVAARAFGAPLFVNEGTHRAAAARLDGQGVSIERFISGQSFRIGALEVATWPKSHDAAEPVAVRVSAGHHALGICTDLGTSDAALEAFLRPCDALLFEANHDPLRLAQGPYPPSLRRRVGGRWGHLSNEDAARALVRIATERLRLVLLGHLSRENNAPELVREAFVRIGGERPGYERRLSLQDKPSALFRPAVAP